MIRVTTPSRLHFGLLSLPCDGDAATAWPDGEGQPTIPARHCGGVGMMIEKPGIVLNVAPASTWSAHGPCGDRALAMARAVCAAWGVSQAFKVIVEHCAPEHVGLGTGTQLGLAVAQALSAATGRSGTSTANLAGLVGRGRRSAIGIHGFEHGGFLVEGGKRNLADLSPLIARVAFPSQWSVLLCIPRGLQGSHGPREAEAFQQIARIKSDQACTDALCRLVLLGVLPALMDHDLDAFGAALYDFNRRVGEMFRPYQGGIYAHPLVAKVVGELRSAGIRGVGQSSWGPCIFGVVPSPEAERLVDWLTRKLSDPGLEMIVTSGQNRGMILETI